MNPRTNGTAESPAVTPARQAFVSERVGREDLTNAIAVILCLRAMTITARPATARTTSARTELKAALAYVATHPVIRALLAGCLRCGSIEPVGWQE